MNGWLQFPDGFLWGSAVSGHQIEGFNKHSDWWHWELATPEQPMSGKAIDYWNRYEEDHELLAKLGHQAFRVGIEWARVEPRKGEFDYATIDHYRHMLDSLRRRGIKICLTLHHWVLPQWVAEQNDWLNPDTLNSFLRYVEFVVEELGEFPDLWLTLNEPMVALLAGNITADFPPKRQSIFSFRKATRNMLRAHAGAYALIHRRYPEARVGIAMAYPCIDPWGMGGLQGWYERLSASFCSKLIFQAWDYSILTGRLHPFFGRGSIEGLKDSIDFCGVNYYLRIMLRFSLRKWHKGFIDIDSIPAGVETTDLGWQIWPEGLSRIIEEVWERHHKPIYITENGIADASDQKRVKYITEHLKQIHTALQKGIPIKGYFHWSFIDNFEWKEGYTQRFGLVAVDFEDPDLTRTPRPSARIYSQIIRDNGFAS